MGFTDFTSESGLNAANEFFSTRSYVEGHSPSQADAVTFKAFKEAPDAEKYPHIVRWHKHIATFEPEFSTLPGDANKPFTAYGPEAKPAAAPAAQGDDDEDLFGSDSEEEDPSVVAERNKRLDEYKKKKESKPQAPAKSFVTMDVKPWDDETNLDELEANVRAIHKDGLTWGASQRVTVGYGLQKLTINLVVEDDKVGTTDLQEDIEGDEDHVQSTDIVAMQKI